jgi:hypothetical protein
MEIRPVGAELFHADARTDTSSEVNGRFWQFFLKCLIEVNHFLSMPRKHVAWYIRKERSEGKRRQEGVDSFKYSTMWTCIPKRRNFTRKVSLYLCNSCLP